MTARNYVYGLVQLQQAYTQNVRPTKYTILNATNFAASLKETLHLTFLLPTYEPASPVATAVCCKVTILCASFIYVSCVCESHAYWKWYISESGMDEQLFLCSIIWLAIIVSSPSKIAII